MINHGPQRLLARIGHRHTREGRVHQRIFCKRVKVVKREHVVEERADARFQTRAREHHIDDARTTLRGLDLAVFRSIKQRRIRSGVPQEKAEP